MLAFRGDEQTPVAPIEDHEPQLLLELGDETAHRRLGEPERLGGVLRGAAGQHQAQCFQLPKFHPRVPCPSVAIADRTI
jgi:hypothetical protein